MKVIGLLFIAGFVLVSCNQAQNQDLDSEQEAMNIIESEAARDGVFIHITESYDDPHRVLMPLRMATMMAEDKDVLVYMDIDAVELLVKSAEDLNYANFESAQTYIKQLIDSNIGVYACPACMEVAGLSQDDL
jgi:predicted peroxiredoxin